MSGTAIYGRVSSEEQRERQTIRTQTEYADAFLRLRGIERWETFLDDGVSGTIPLEKRPGGAALLAAARAGRITTVYVYKLDRLGRDIRVILEAMHQLEQAGCALVSMTESFETVTPAGRAMLGMLAVFAGFERDQMQARIRDGKEAAMKKPAKWLGGPRPPYGYRVEGKGHTAVLVVNEDEARYVEGMFRLYLNEAMNTYQIADYLNSVGAPTPFAGSRFPHWRTGAPPSGKWSNVQVVRILRNSSYCGTRKHNKLSARPVLEQECPPLVSVEQWEHVQRELTKARKTHAPHGSRVYLLRGLMICALCGQKYHGYPSNEGRLIYYRCYSKGTRKGCAAKSIPTHVADGEVWPKILRRIRKLKADALRETVDEGDAERENDELGLIAKLIEAKTLERDRVLRLYRRGQIKDQDLDTQLEEIDAEQAALTERWQGLQAPRPQEPRPERADVMKQIEDELRDNDDWARQRVAALLIERIDAVPVPESYPKLQIHWRV